MPKIIPNEAKTRALELYLENVYSAREIADTLTTEFMVDISNQTVYSWIKRYKWDEQLEKAKVKAIEKAAETESERLARLQKEHLDVYENIRRKAYSELNVLTFDRAIDAVKAATMGIQGERQVLEGLINLQFVQDVIQVLIDEIDDADLMKRIAAKLKLLVAANTRDEKNLVANG
jgi:transposase